MLSMRILAFVLLLVMQFSFPVEVADPTVARPFAENITATVQPDEQPANLVSTKETKSEQWRITTQTTFGQDQPVTTAQTQLPVYTAPAAAQAEETQEEIQLALYTFAMDRKNDQILATVSLTNQTQNNISCILYSVIKNADGTVASSAMVPTTAKAGTNKVAVHHSFDAPGEDQQWLVYCWNHTMQPLCEPLTVPLTFTQTVTHITLSYTQMDLYVSPGTPGKLTYTVTPGNLTDPGVTFTSDNTDVATVSAQGIITPVATGNANITVLAKDRSAYGVCAVRVISKPTEIVLNAADLTMEETETFQLTPNITPADAPNRTVIYKTDNGSVATVTEKGLIRAVKAGTATITATTGDGQASATCRITVTPAVKNLRLNKTSIAMWDYGMYYLTATYTGSSSHKIVWTSSDDSVATVSDSGIVFGVAKGSAIITATVGTVKTSCKVQVYREYDYTGSIAAHFESGDNPGSISGSGTGKSYGCFQLYAGSNGPKSFYNWLISTGFNKDIGNTLKTAHQKDGGKDKTFGTNFDNAWKTIAKNQKDEFRSCQMAYCMSLYYEPLVNRLVSELNFYPDNYSLALKSALWSRAIQHGVGGAFNRIEAAFNTLGGFEGKTEKQLIAAIYAECGKVVSTPPSDSSVPMNSNSSIAVEYGLVGKYMKYYSSSSSSMQAGVWKRLNITEPGMLYDLLENPPVLITP